MVIFYLSTIAKISTLLNLLEECSGVFRHSELSVGVGSTLIPTTTKKRKKKEDIEETKEMRIMLENPDSPVVLRYGNTNSG